MTLVLDWSFVRHIKGYNRLFQEGFDQLQGVCLAILKGLQFPENNFLPA